MVNLVGTSCANLGKDIETEQMIPNEAVHEITEGVISYLKGNQYLIQNGGQDKSERESREEKQRLNTELTQLNLLLGRQTVIVCNCEFDSENWKDFKATNNKVDFFLNGIRRENPSIQNETEHEAVTLVVFATRNTPLVEKSHVLLELLKESLDCSVELHYNTGSKLNLSRDFTSCKFLPNERQIILSSIGNNEGLLLRISNSQPLSPLTLDQVQFTTFIGELDRLKRLEEEIAIIESELVPYLDVKGKITFTLHTGIGLLNQIIPRVRSIDANKTEIKKNQQSVFLITLLTIGFVGLIWWFRSELFYGSAAAVADDVLTQGALGISEKLRTIFTIICTIYVGIVSWLARDISVRKINEVVVRFMDLPIDSVRLDQLSEQFQSLLASNSGVDTESRMDFISKKRLLKEKIDSVYKEIVPQFEQLYPTNSALTEETRRKLDTIKQFSEEPEPNDAHQTAGSGENEININLFIDVLCSWVNDKTQGMNYNDASAVKIFLYNCIVLINGIEQFKDELETATDINDMFIMMQNKSEEILSKFKIPIRGMQSLEYERPQIEEYGGKRYRKTMKRIKRSSKRNNKNKKQKTKNQKRTTKTKRVKRVYRKK